MRPAPTAIDGARGDAGFKRGCAVVGLLFLLVTQFGKLVYYDYRHLTTYQDFPQYYMGGLVALHGRWDSLYPIPNPSSDANPGFIENSTMRPGYADLANNAGIGQAVRYMQPPPLALLLTPLALLPAHVSFYVWTLLLTVAAWGIALQSAKMYELCSGEEGSVAAGLIILLICLSPQAHRWIRVSNMSVLMGWLIGVATLALVRRRDADGAAALVLGAVAKYALLILAPLYLAMRRWRAIAYCVAGGLVLLGVSAAVMGTGPYRTFLQEILPTLGRTTQVAENQSLSATILRLSGMGRMPPHAAAALALTELAYLVLILVFVLSAPQRYWLRPVNVLGAALALVAWMLVFSPMTWEHYFAYLAPFWGWMIYQATRSGGRLVTVVLAIGLCYLPILPRGLIHRMGLPEALFSHLCWSLVLTLLLATWVMLRDREESGVVLGAGARQSG